MGFLIQNVVKNKKDTCFLQCEVTYNVVMEKIRLKIEEGDMFSEIYRFTTIFEVRLFDYVKDFLFTGYENKIFFDVFVTDLGDNNLKYIQNDEDLLRKRIEEYQSKTPHNERESHCEGDRNIFVVDIKKFVLDYARQISFFEEECEYANDFENALTSKDISIIDGNVTHSESVYTPKRTIEEIKMHNDRHMEIMEKHRNRKSFEASKFKRDDAYYTEIDKITEKGYPVLKPDEIDKYYARYINMNEDTDSSMTLKERDLYEFVRTTVHKRLAQEIEDLENAKGVSAGKRGGAGGGPASTETKPAADGVKPATPETSRSDPVPAVAGISGAAQPAAKRSKVSLARQQAANAPMDAT